MSSSSSSSSSSSCTSSSITSKRKRFIHGQTDASQATLSCLNNIKRRQVCTSITGQRQSAYTLRLFDLKSRESALSVIQSIFPLLQTSALVDVILGEYLTYDDRDALKQVSCQYYRYMHKHYVFNKLTIGYKMAKTDNDLSRDITELHIRTSFLDERHIYNFSDQSIRLRADISTRILKCNPHIKKLIIETQTKLQAPWTDVHGTALERSSSFRVLSGVCSVYPHIEEIKIIGNGDTKILSGINTSYPFPNARRISAFHVSVGLLADLSNTKRCEELALFFDTSSSGILLKRATELKRLVLMRNNATGWDDAAALREHMVMEIVGSCLHTFDKLQLLVVSCPLVFTCDTFTLFNKIPNVSVVCNDDGFFNHLADVAQDDHHQHQHQHQHKLTSIYIQFGHTRQQYDIAEENNFYLDAYTAKPSHIRNVYIAKTFVHPYNQLEEFDSAFEGVEPIEPDASLVRVDAYLCEE